jgi:membrane protease YdiL (CAAX protease family)
MYGSAERLQALADGYFSLNNAFLIYVLLYAAFVVLRLAVLVNMPPETALPIGLAGIGILFVSSFLLSYRPNKKIAEGKGAPPSNAVLYSVIVAMLFWLCCGAIGFLIPQSIATSEIKKYGLKVGSFSSLKKADVLAKITEMRMAENQPQPAVPPSGLEA